MIFLTIYLSSSLSSFFLFLAANNNFVGTIPTQIAALTNLERLYLGMNKFTGTIPAELGLLTKLFYLQIEDNFFTGTVPDQVCNLRNLELDFFIATCFRVMDGVGIGVVCPEPSCCSDCT